MLSGGQGNNQASPLDLAPADRTIVRAILCKGDLRNPKRTSTFGSEAGLIKRPVRSCRRWQLSFLQLDLRGNLLLDMHLEFCYPCQSQVAPNVSTIVPSLGMQLILSLARSAGFERRD